MAEGGLHNSIQELLMCAFCLDEATGPKSLNCQHTFCLKCLTDYINTKDTKDKIECPTCRQWSTLPKGGLDGLQVNFFFNQLKDAADKPNVRLTSQVSLRAAPICASPECEAKPAVKYCDKCEYLCTDCERDHKSVGILKAHKLLSLEDAQQVKSPACDKHPDELIKFYCADCNVAVCSHCCILLHSQHQLVELAEKAAEAKAELKDVLHQVHDAMENVKATEVTVKERAAEIDATDIKEEVHREVMALEASINDDVDEVCYHVSKQLQAESDRLSVTLATLESIELCGEKLLQHGNPADYMMTVPVLVKQLRDNNPDNMTCLVDDVDLTHVKQEIEAIKNYKETYDELQRKESELYKLKKENQELKDSLRERHRNDGDEGQSPDLENQGDTQGASALDPQQTTIDQSLPQPEGGVWSAEYTYKWRHKVIQITCTFQSGTQTAAHPCPGNHYWGTILTAYLPDMDTKEGSRKGLRGGRDLCKRLEKAFHARKLVKVKNNQLVWNGVHLIEASWSWLHVYPPEYMARIKEQLDRWAIL